MTPLNLGDHLHQSGRKNLRPLEVKMAMTDTGDFSEKKTKNLNNYFNRQVCLSIHLFHTLAGVKNSYN